MHIKGGTDLDCLNSSSQIPARLKPRLPWKGHCFALTMFGFVGVQNGKCYNTRQLTSIFSVIYGSSFFAWSLVIHLSFF